MLVFAAFRAGLVEAQEVGVAAAVYGNVKVTTPWQSVRVLQSGMPVFLGDYVTTAADGRLQILLRDESVFTLGADSQIILDELEGYSKVDVSVKSGIVTLRGNGVVGPAGGPAH